MLDDVARHKALGWQIETTVPDGHLRFSVRDRAGQPVSGTLTAIATRPLGAASPTNLHFSVDENGALYSNEILATGQWDVEISFKSASGETYPLTRRVVAP